MVASMRASGAPRQKWRPWPKANWSATSGRVMRNSAGAWKCASSRFAEPNNSFTIAPSGIVVPATWVSRVVTRNTPGTGLSYRMPSSAAAPGSRKPAEIGRVLLGDPHEFGGDAQREGPGIGRLEKCHAVLANLCNQTVEQFVAGGAYLGFKCVGALRAKRTHEQAAQPIVLRRIHFEDSRQEVLEALDL